MVLMGFIELPEFVSHPLLQEAEVLCQKLNAPLRLQAHLTLVFDVAVKILHQFDRVFGNLKLDQQAVLFGAATHDLGKAVYLDEIKESGKLHEMFGPDILHQHGVPLELARFAQTHAAWKNHETLPTLTFEDLLVGLSDNWWKGKRPEPLERAVVQHLQDQKGGDFWLIFNQLDLIAQDITQDSNQRVLWLRQFPVPDAA